MKTTPRGFVARYGWWAALALALLIPLMFAGFIAGILAEMFLIGFRAGQEIIEGVADDALAARREKRW